jgi:alpha-1,2-mannosyltransferase
MCLAGHDGAVRAPSKATVVLRQATVADSPHASSRGVMSTGSRLRIALPWACVVLLAITEAIAHRFHLPSGRGWLDTYVYAHSASDFLAHPSHLYDAAVPQLTNASPRNAFIYPPSALLGFLPLVPLTRTLGVAWTAELWTWLDTAALVVGLTLIARQLSMGWERAGWIIAALMLSLPVLSEVDSGQVEGVIVLLLALSWRQWPRTSSGVLLGVALAVKPIAPWLLLLPFALRRPRVAVAAVATLVLLNAPFLPFIGGDGLGFYVLHFLPYMAGHVMQDVANLSVANVLQSWLGGVPLVPADHLSLSPLHSILLADVVLWTLRAVALLLLARELRQRRKPPMVLFAMALAAVPLFAPIAWPHYYVFVLPAVLVLLTARSVPVRRATLGAVLCCTVLNSVLDAATFHLAMYPGDLLRDRSAANALVVVQGELLAVACVVVVVALALVRLPSRVPWHAAPAAAPGRPAAAAALAR